MTNISNVKSTNINAKISQVKSVKTASTPVIRFSNQDEKQKNFLNTIDSVLDSQDYLKTAIKEKNGVKFLRISRPSNDIDRPGSDGSDQLCMYKIKSKLGLKDSVIADNNNSFAVTLRNQWSDNATIEKGSYLDIPLSEIGQKRYISFTYGITDISKLKEAVNQLIN